jgi:hypothetical protein
LRFVIFSIVFLTFACLLVSIATFHSVWSDLLGKSISTINLNTMYSVSLKKFMLLDAGLIILMAVLSTLGIMLLSHKIAGPAYRIQQILKDLQEGKDPNFQLRKGDTLKPIAEELGKFASQHRKLNESAGEVIERWKNTEVKDMSLEIALKKMEKEVLQPLTPEKKEEQK